MYADDTSDRPDGLIDLYDEVSDRILVFADLAEVDAWCGGQEVEPLSTRIPTDKDRAALQAVLSAL